MANDKWSGSNPWLGLAPYTEGTPLYGRTQESAVLSEIIKGNIATIVYGKSGIGKSSLLSAGISPMLRGEQYIPVPLRLVHNTEISYVEQIENRVRELIDCKDELPENVPNLGLWDFFHRNTFTKNGVFCQPVIILDQFEEIYTLTDVEHKPEIITLFTELASLLNDIKPDAVLAAESSFTDGTNTSASSDDDFSFELSTESSFAYKETVSFRFVICLREDKLYLLERNSSNIPSIKTNRYNLQALSPESALEVITCPRPDLFSAEEATAIVDKLADMGDEGIRTVDPAILSLFLYKYFEKKGEANYDNIFADYYREATKSIKDKSLAFLEDHLLTLGGYRNQIPVDDAISSGVSSSEIDSLLKQIILRSEKRKGIDYIEFSHDRLCAEAKKSREERKVREQARKVRKRMFMSVSIFAASLGVLSYLLFLMFSLQSSEKGRLSAEEAQRIEREARIAEQRQKEMIRMQSDSLVLLNDKNMRQRDSLIVLNAKNIAQTMEIKRQRDELQTKNKELNNQLAQIEEQQHLIDELRSLSSIEEIVIEDNIAGKLADRLPYNALVNLSCLTVTGEINGTDISYIQNACKEGKLKQLNLSGTKLVDGGSVHNKCVFPNSKYLEIVSLPNNLKIIDSEAFYSCTKLMHVDIPNTVTSIGKMAFYDCSMLTSITIPSAVKQIGESSFRRCSHLTSFTIPNGVEIISSSAFAFCSSLTAVDIPNSVKIIGEGAFEKCIALKSAIIPNGVTAVKMNTFYYCNNLTSVTIPDSLTTIDRFAFAGCSSLTAIDFPPSVASIGEYAFSGCSSINSISIPHKVKQIGTEVFKGCTALSSVIIPESVTTIGESAFAECSNLTSIAIPTGVISIGVGAFQSCKGLTSVFISNSVKEIQRGAFANCTNLEKIDVQKGNTKYDSRENCNAIIETSTNKLITGTNSTIIPNSVTSIGDYAFCGYSNLNSINIPNSIVSIGYKAFSVTGLTSINIPKSVSEIGSHAFTYCTNLKSIKVENGNNKYDSRENCNAIIETSKNRLLMACNNSIIPNNVTSIENYAFYGCSGITTLSLPKSLTLIGNHAFQNCSGLTSILIPNNVETIGEAAFAGCSNLSSITLSKCLRLISSDTFYGCKSLTEIAIPNSVISIGGRAFENCSSLTSIDISNNVSSVAYEAFKGCSALVHFTLPPKIASIFPSTFDGCMSLTSITIPNNVTAIHYDAFRDCTHLRNINCHIRNINAVTVKDLKGIPADCQWHVPVGKTYNYKSQSWWVSTWAIIDDLE